MDAFKNLPQAVANTLIKLRKDAGWSQRKLSLISKLGRASIVEVEQGQYLPSLKSLFVLAEAFNIPVEHLVGLISQEQKRLSETETSQNPEDKLP